MKSWCWLVFLISAVCSLDYQADPSFVQAKRIIAYADRSVAMNTSGTLEITDTYSQSFSELPTVFYAFCGFDMVPTSIIDYEVKNTGKSISGANFSIRLGHFTITHRIIVNTLAVDFFNSSVQSHSYYSSICSQRVNFSKCQQNFLVPAGILPNVFSLTALFMVNTWMENQKALVKNYQFDIVIIDDGYLASFSQTVKVYNFTYTFLEIPKESLVNKHYLLFYGVVAVADIQVSQLLDSNSSFYGDIAQSSVVGLFGMNFDDSNSLSFQVWLTPNLYLQASVPTPFPTNPTPSYVDISYLVIASIPCSKGLYLHGADCWTCDPRFCAACQGGLCSSCRDTRRYLKKWDNKGGDCVCKQGTIDFEGFCVECEEKCMNCEGNIGNCTKCKYGYQLVNGMCLNICYMMKSYVDGDCVMCQEGCAVCQSSTKCIRTICSPPLYYYKDQCLETCPDNTYSDNWQCLPCSLNCLTCSAYQTCSLCKDGSYVGFDGFCKVCDPPCLSCNGPGNKSCTSCKQGPSIDGKCEQPLTTPYKLCGAGLFFNGSGCVACAVGCEICSPNGCLYCNKSFLLQNGSCKECGAIIGFGIVNNACTEICGDRIKVFAQCDDGNLLNGDGCSSNCTIQSGFVCEVNAVFGSGDMCYKTDKIILPKISRSLTQNKIHISLTPQIGNLKTLGLTCNESFGLPSSTHIVNQQISNQNILIQLQFSQSIQGHKCELVLTPSKSIKFTIVTLPPAIALYPSITNQFVQVALFIKALLIIAFLIMLAFHLVVPWVTSDFIINVCLFLISLYNYQFVPGPIYLFLSSFTQISLGFKDYSIIPISSGKIESENIKIQHTWPIWLFILLYCIIATILRFTKKKLPKALSILLYRPIKGTLQFIHYTFIMYEPLLLARLIISVRNSLKPIDYVFIVFYVQSAISASVMLYVFMKKSKKNKGWNKIDTRIMAIFYVFFLVGEFPKNQIFGPLFIIIYSSCCTIKHALELFAQKQRKIKRQNKSQNTCLYKCSKKSIVQLGYLQIFFNNGFLIINNFIQICGHFVKPQTNYQIVIPTIIVLINLLIFILSNIVIIVFSFIAKLKSSKRRSLIVQNKYLQKKTKNKTTKRRIPRKVNNQRLAEILRLQPE